MIVSEFIGWLKTLPQDAKVSVLSHSDGGGYYMQGGSCTTEEFHDGVEWRHGEDWYIYGNHFELNSQAGKEYTLQLGVKNK
ncbi:hypothetical protein PHB09_129 [Pseudomonas phage PHB09]|uniref:Uncharacterized protein n=1 Tax=Pseudomonas phage PHB09 TaxID=2867265 RepID=A0AAE8XCE1_9CAUD|nr:hypothetical protein QGX10_gp128 [Pseudomonas phage PHB09]UAV84624.1 hypothetical protein PHB09_129 [Pseudomonas phage PHB09]